MVVEFNCFLFNQIFFKDASGSIPWRVQKNEMCFIGWMFQVRFLKDGLVNKIIVKLERSWPVFIFLFSKKAKTSCSFEFNCFFTSIKHFFKDASGSIPGASRKATFEICLKRTSQVRFLKDGFG